MIRLYHLISRLSIPDKSFLFKHVSLFDEVFVEGPPTNILQESDDLETMIELRTTQIQEREDDEDINPEDATTTSTRCMTSSTSTTSSPIGLSATAMPYYPVGPNYPYMPWCYVYMP